MPLILGPREGACFCPLWRTNMMDVEFYLVGIFFPISIFSYFILENNGLTTNAKGTSTRPQWSLGRECHEIDRAQACVSAIFSASLSAT